MSSISGGAFGLAFLMLFLQIGSPVLAQTQDLIVDICTTPNSYWNKQVFLKGHVVRVTPDPPGTNRGRFTLRDQSDKDIEITTEDLPAMGKVYTVRGIVIQKMPGDMVPLVKENSRVLAEPTPGNPQEPGTVKPATTPPAPAPVTSSGGQALTKKELEDAVRRELDQRDAQSKQAQAPAAIPATPPAPAPTPGMWDNPWMILGAAVVVVAIIGVLILALRSKPAPAAAAPSYSAAPAAAPTMATAAAGQATQTAKGVPTMVAGAPTQAIMQLGANLSFTEGPDRGRNIALGKPVTTIGRSGARKNDVELSDGTVSREQAKILYNQADKSFTLVNEATTNPTRVNGSTVVSVALANNDKIEFGNTVIRFLRT